MADILDRLEKLEGLVRHDDEARTICSDARAEIVKLRGTGNAGAAANAAAHSWYRSSLAAPMPPSRTTQVKWEYDTTLRPWELIGDAPSRNTQVKFGKSPIDELEDFNREIQKIIAETRLSFDANDES